MVKNNRDLFGEVWRGFYATATLFGRVLFVVGNIIFEFSKWMLKQMTAYFDRQFENDNRKKTKIVKK